MAASQNGREISYGQFWKALTNEFGALDSLDVTLPDGEKVMSLDITGKIKIEKEE